MSNQKLRQIAASLPMYQARDKDGNPMVRKVKRVVYGHQILAVKPGADVQADKRYVVEIDEPVLMPHFANLQAVKRTHGEAGVQRYIEQAKLHAKPEQK